MRGDSLDASTTSSFVVTRTDTTLHAQHTVDGQERMTIDLDFSTARSKLIATMRASESSDLTILIDVVRPASGATLDGRATLRRGTTVAQLELVAGTTSFAGVTYDITMPGARATLSQALGADLLGEGFRVIAPFHDALTSRALESFAIFDVVSLYDARGDTVWPALGDPLDLAPPGHREGDVFGVGMTCSPNIRCTNLAPFCVTTNHATGTGFCTRVCRTSDDCMTGGPAATSTCTTTITDIPGVTRAQPGCELPCAAGVCPRFLVCDTASRTCAAP